MVKGLSRKVIIVKSPDPKIFEQAIFVVRDDYLMTKGIDQKELLRQAKRAANGYVEQTYGWKQARILRMLLIGASAAAIIGLLCAAINLLL